MVVDKWIPFNEVDFSQPGLTAVHIDTRDFCCNTSFEPLGEKVLRELPTLLKYNSQYFFTEQELKDCIADLYKRSGGNRTWRHLYFKNHNEITGWDFKYLRIFKTEHGFIMGTGRMVKYYFYRKAFFTKELSNE